MKPLFLAQQDSSTRRWAPVGRLLRENDVYSFVYTKGTKEVSDFQPFKLMGDLSRTYKSTELFPIFKNRILPKSRPEYREYLSWLGLTDSSHSALEELRRTAGVRATDSFEIFPMPQPNRAGMYDVHFFARGIGHLPREAQYRVSTLEKGERLFLMADLQNEYDNDALLLRTGDPLSAVGYIPKVYSGDVCEIVQTCGQAKVAVYVDRINHDAPTQFKMLCRMEASWPPSFTPCSRESFEPWAGAAP